MNEGGEREKWKFKEKKKGRGEKVCLPVAERNRVDGIISHSPTSWTSLNDNATCIPNGGLYSARDVTRGAAMWTRVGIFLFLFFPPLYFSLYEICIFNEVKDKWQRFVENCLNIVRSPQCYVHA